LIQAAAQFGRELRREWHGDSSHSRGRPKVTGAHLLVELVDYPLLRPIKNAGLRRRDQFPALPPGGTVQSLADKDV